MRHKIRLIILLVLLAMSLEAYTQPASNLRYRILSSSEMEWKLDTLIVMPGTFLLIRQNGDTVPESQYTLTGWTATLKLSPEGDWSNDSVLLAKYRVISSTVLPVYRDERLRPEQELKRLTDISYLYSYEDLQKRDDESFLNFGSLQRSGSISRAISVGNNQDAVLNSTMNLQLSGELAPGIEIVAAITDNTIPIQPDGASQQLREFDKVFIKARAEHWEIVAGDFEILNGEGQFLRFNKKGQGILFSNEYSAGKNKQWSMSSRVSGAIARGKYTTNQFNGIEGNQGPYKLTGANNEQFIVVLAGSERIYIDGKLLTRGANNDYIIDYNSSQITFTPNQQVTKDRRIIAHFEYAERNYNRSMIYLQQQASTKRVTFRLQYYNEQDIRSQPMSQEQLLEENMELLAEIGDDLSRAVVPNVKEVPFNNSEVLYMRIDTLVGMTVYSPVYVYSTNPDSARYRLGFSFVGQGNGNYRQSSSSANGKVFQWIAPQGGVPQGDHEPVILLVTPKRQQMVTFSGTWRATDRLNIFAETAVSGLNLNTFSSLDDDDNTGMALTAGFLRRVNKKAEDTTLWNFEAEGLYRWINKRFSVVERFKDIEFERDWNITSQENHDEHYGRIQLRLSRKQNFSSTYTFEPLVSSPENYALRHSAAINAGVGPWRAAGQASLMANENSFLPGRFIRHFMTVERRSGSISFIILQEGEENRQHLPGNDSLHGNSFAFQRWQATIERKDSAGLKTSVRVRQRYDNMPENSSFIRSARADEVWAGVGSTGNPAQQFDFNIGYRKLNLEQQLPGKGPEESLLGRGEYNHRFWKGLIRGSVFYEFGSGLEYKKEFSYLEVAPGQGIYTWNDYNSDSIKQLDEFEVAVYQDEASYIRIFTPTNEFERVYTMQYNQTLNIDPATRVNRDKAIGRFLALFTDQGHYRIEQKVGGGNIFGALDPFFANGDDPALINLSTSLRNTLFFNRSSSKYSIEYTTARNESKMLLVNGFENRGQIQHIIRGRWNISRTFILRTEGSTGSRDRSSEFFATNNYNIELWGSAAELQYQPGTNYRVGMKYQYSEKRNTLGAEGEMADIHRTSTEFRYSMPMKGTVQALVEYIGISYNSTEQSSLAFEMLEGLRPGNNFTWTLGYQRILANNMQVSVQYNGRKSPSNPMVHVGTVQVRAFF